MNSTASFLCDYHICLINLPERTDRRKAAEDELARIGLHVGPDGVSLFSATKFLHPAGFPSSSIRGAFHSHSECLREGLKLRRHVMLLEDDIAFAACFANVLPALQAKLDSLSWDFCYLGHESTGNVERANSRTTHVRLVRHDGPIIGLHFCLVNIRILARLLEHLDRVSNGDPGDDDYGPMPVDGALNTFRRLNPDVCTLIADPKLGWQRPSRSDITPRFFDRLERLRPLISALRAVKEKALRWRS